MALEAADRRYLPATFIEKQLTLRALTLLCRATTSRNLFRFLDPKSFGLWLSLELSRVRFVPQATKIFTFKPNFVPNGGRPKLGAFLAIPSAPRVRKIKKPKRAATPLAPTKLRPEEEAPENIDEIELDYGDTDVVMDVDHPPQDHTDGSEYPTGEDPSMTDLIDRPTAGTTYADVAAKPDVMPLPQINARPRNKDTVSRAPTAPQSGRAI